MSIDYLMARDDGWYLVFFQSDVIEIQNNCGAMTNTAYGPSVVNRRVVYIAPSTIGAKSLFGQLLTAQLVGKKIVSVTFDISEGYCRMWALRTAP